MSHRILIFLSVGALAFVAACGGGSTTATGAPASAAASAAASGGSSAAAACAPSDATPTVTSSMANTAFAPADITAKVGDVIGWTNKDSVQHTATLESDPACTTAIIRNGQTGSLVFNVAGTYKYFCKIHPSMTGTITVTG
jgi:plastocyanin